MTQKTAPWTGQLSNLAGDLFSPLVMAGSQIASDVKKSISNVKAFVPPPPLPTPPTPPTVPGSEAPMTSLSVEEFEQRFPLAKRQELGHGTFGRVESAWDATRQKEVALKTLFFQNDHEFKNLKQALLREVFLLQQLDQENIIKYYDVFELPLVGPAKYPVVALTMELAGANLEDAWLGKNLSVFDWAVLGENMATALVELKKHGLVHRDIKLANICLTQDGSRTILIDFGMVCLQWCRFSCRRCIQAMSGTPLYLSPEIVQSLGKTKTLPFNSDMLLAADVWAVGISLLFLAEGHVFHWDKQHPELLHHQLNSPKLRADQKEILLRMLNVDWQQRAKPGEVFELFDQMKRSL